LTNRRLDPATFQALQALVSRGQMRVGPALASAIRERRELLGKSVRALADHFQVGEDTLAEIEEGESSIPAATLVKLAQALEVDLVWFIEREPTFFAGPEGGGPFEVEGALLEAKQGLALLQAFAAIKHPAAREKVLKLAQKFAADAESNNDEFDES
jgi:transcriptional regulator with XRE-family HTH domain